MGDWDDLLRLIKLHEGLRLNPYKDTVGKWTIGYGRNLSDRGITAQEAEYLLVQDLNDVMFWMNKLGAYAGLNKPRKAVLVDMCFNLGITKLLQFKDTLAAIKSGDYELAAKMMLQSRWAKQVGPRAVRLAKMMQTGEWPNDV